MNDIKVGTFTGSASAVNVVCGFIPSAVIIMEPSVPTFCVLEVGASGVGQEIAAAAVAATAGDAIPYGDTSGDTGQGFTVAAGAGANVNAQTITYIALR